MKKIVAFTITIALCCILLLGAQDFPPFGNDKNPVNNEVSQYYIENSIKDTGATNIVTGVILDYRSFDTFVESSVLFTAAVAVIIILKEK